MRLSTRLTIAMVALVFLTSTAIGVITYREVAAVALPRSLDRLHIQARLLGLDLESSRRGARFFVEGSVAAVALQGMIRAPAAGGVDPVDRLTEAEWQARSAHFTLGRVLLSRRGRWQTP
jgi:hypothetical protein